MLLNELSAAQAAKLIAERAVSSEELVRACLDRIAAREPEIQAWATLSPERALEQARQRDRETPAGPLHGVPIAVKDVLDTADMTTEMGSPIYKDHRPFADAACVAAARAAGAVILGKTVTAEFAYVAPGPTRNPHNLAHTPGGSSSGSAAAVADFMVPAAFGTQTSGSVLRPASFCGIVGFKPTYGLVSRAGLKLGAEDLDTVGWLARAPEDIALIKRVLTSEESGAAESESRTPPRIGLCRTYMWDHASPASRDAVAFAAARLSAAGARVAEFDLPAGFDGLSTARETINSVERARGGAWEWHHHRDRLSEPLRRCIAQGLATPDADYLAALQLAERCRLEMDRAFAGWDALLTPAANGEAPEGLASTGDSRFQGLWTLLHTPAISLPAHKGPHGLPVGIQLVAPRYADDRLLKIAGWAWTALDAARATV